MRALLARELRLAWRSGAEILNPLWFFLIVITLFPFGVGAAPQLLAQIAPGVVWVAALLAALLVMDRLFRDDWQDGSLEQLMLLPTPLVAVVLVKVVAHWMMSGLPLLIVSPLAALLLGMSLHDAGVLALTLLLGTPTLSFLGAVGAVCTLVALVSGAAWGKPMWGTWWIWDARLTSELVLLFLYAGVIALWHAFDDRRLAGRAAGILVLVGVVNLPIIHYSVYWWNTLHQGSTNLQQTIDPSMRLPLRICIFAFLTLSVTLTLMRLRNLILQLERRRPWVVALVNKGAAR